ncbi:MAG: hypothetical protein CM15mP83_9520 [Flavobacteriaceae bacterium]|nr:MAG: hypothetical protein CM15mP83_9520 [Flavobacteriaceae bacterium]
MPTKSKLRMPITTIATSCANRWERARGCVLQKKRPEGKEIETNRDYLFLYDGAEIYIPKNGVYDTSRFELGFEEMN